MGNRAEGSDVWLQTQSRLSKLLVHDFKNPISALSTNLSYLYRTLPDLSEDRHSGMNDSMITELRGAVADSILAAEMLLRFSENLQQIARLENKEQVEINEVIVDEFIRAAVKRCAGSAESAGVRLEMKEPIVQTVCLWQQRYAELVLDNLIMCAIRHSPKDAPVIVGAVEDPQGVRISVHDQGYPIAEGLVDGLFTRDGQAEAKNQPGSRYGRGLGLYAVGLAVGALNGRTEVETSDKDTRIAVILPTR